MPSWLSHCLSPSSRCATLLSCAVDHRCPCHRPVHRLPPLHCAPTPRCHRRNSRHQAAAAVALSRCRHRRCCRRAAVKLPPTSRCRAAADAAAAAAPPLSCRRRRTVALPPPPLLQPRRRQAAANVVLSRCRHRRSLCTAATALPSSRCAPPPRFALPPLPLPPPPRRRQAAANVALSRCRCRAAAAALIVPASPLVAVASVSQGMLVRTPHLSNSSRCSSTVCSLAMARASAPSTSRTSTLIPQCPILSMSTLKSQTSQLNSLRNTSLQVQTALAGSTSKFAAAAMVFPRPAF